MVGRAQFVTDHAITIGAPPSAIWPWLLQMGRHRGGWYTARWVDALLFPANLRAADRIHPEWQDLAVGDRILDGAPETGCHFVVRELAAERHLVLHSTSHLPASFRRRYGAWLDWSWTFVLRGLGDGRTRFHFRSRARLGPRWLALAYRAALIPADHVMSRQMLRGIATRAVRHPPAGPGTDGTPTGGRAAAAVAPGGSPRSGLDLYWIPLGAGDLIVQASGRIYESLMARHDHRAPCALYHSALVAQTPAGMCVVEVTPVPGDGDDRGVIARGAVGYRPLGRFRIFRYEVRRWVDGAIPDLAFAVGDPVTLTTAEGRVREALACVERVPTPVWGRDELAAGEMWNSNSVIAWIIERSGLLGAAGRPPDGGRAPGWDAGVTVARREAGG